MRDWNLRPGDPLALTLAADFRFCTPDYINDQIWELETGGDPPALSLYTTYGLRARRVRIFPRFTLGTQSVTDPGSFSITPCLHRFFPNFLSLDFSPFPGLDVTGEYWVPDSHAVAGRLTVTNHGDGPKHLLLELCGQLTPLEGQTFAPLTMQSVNLLAGQCTDLAPVIFLTGGPQAGPGPYPSLALDLNLSAESTRTLTWVQAALTTHSDSFEHARAISAHQWEAERARIEITNASQTIDVHTGDPDWDAAFALSQKTAFGLFFGPTQYLPNPSFVISRLPDHGYSLSRNGSDYPDLWCGQPVLEAGYLASQVQGAPRLAAGLVRNFLEAQSGNGLVDGKPGLAGQRGHWLAAPMLANLAWRVFQHSRDLAFLQEVQPRLEAFINCWYDKAYDRDNDGFPEWDHPVQTGFENNPAFSVWRADAQGAEISTSESPALAAMLSMETKALAQIAEALDQPEKNSHWYKESERFSHLTEECWDDKEKLYHLRDRDTHSRPTGKSLGTRRGAGLLIIKRKINQPVRLLIRIEFAGEVTHRPEVNLRGLNGESHQTELLARKDFLWGPGLAVATTRLVYTSIEEITVDGLEKRDRVSVLVMDFSAEDVTLFLPLLAGIPDAGDAESLINRVVLGADRFGGRFGIRDCEEAPVPAETKSKQVSEGVRNSSTQQPALSSTTVQLPWNALIGEGLLKYNLRNEAAGLTTRLMAAVIQNLKQEHAFFSAYHSASGAGIGERNPVQGLAPLGLFLDTLGVRIEPVHGTPGCNQRVILSGKNPFPWPVTVKYMGLTVTRGADETVVTFPDGRNIRFEDPTDAEVSSEPAH